MQNDHRPIRLEAPTPSRRPYHRWRAATLLGIHVLIAIHIAHWLVAGRTLAPLDLNEVLITVHVGVVTAATVFMTLVALSVLVFGRFFCSWACHVIALQDACAWILRTLRIKPPRVRSRVLLFVPLGVMLYLFVWPQVMRLWAGQPAVELVTLSDAEGWGSFTTDDFWRNLPDPIISVATLLVCGFATVYVLGTRAFCTYACPWGALFDLLDRAAPGRIVAEGDCTQCGKCTAVCDSRVRVHEEIRDHGMVVSGGCLKDLDCISACPNGILKYGFRRPVRAARARPPRYDLSLKADLLMGVVFLGMLLVFRGLYDAIPLLMALGLAGVLTWLAVAGVRLLAKRRVRLGHLVLNRAGRLTRAGVVVSALLVVTGALVVHSGFIRYHEYFGQRAFDRIDATNDETGEHARVALSHFETCETRGLFVPISLRRRLASLYLRQGRAADARDQLEAILARAPDDLQARFHLGKALALLGAGDEAEDELRRVSEAASLPAPARAHASEALGDVLERKGDHTGAIDSFSKAVEARPDRVRARVALGALLAREGRTEAAAEQLRRAVAIDPSSVAAHNNLGVVLVRLGRADEAAVVLRASVTLDPTASGLTNLAAVLLRLGRVDEARGALRRALEIDPGGRRARALEASLRARSQ